MITPPVPPDLEKAKFDFPVVDKKKIRIIDSLWTFLVATAVLGPFALPLLWRNPRFKWSTKVAGSLAVLGFTWFLLWFSSKFMASQLDQFQALKDQLQLLQQQGN